MKTFTKVSIFTVFSFALAGAGTGAEDAAAKKKAMTLGKQNFVTCMACHGPDGKGLKLGPTMVMAPTFQKSKYMLATPEVPISIVLKGILKQDAKYAGMMAPLGAALDDKKLAAVLTYVRNSFGNKAVMVTPEEVKVVRAKLKSRTQPWKRSDLDVLLEESKKKAKDTAKK